MATLSMSRAHIYFDPTDPTKTKVLVNSTTRTANYGLTVTTPPLDSIYNRVTTVKVLDTTIVSWHLTNSACKELELMLCVAINGIAKFKHHSDGTVSYVVDRDAFPSLQYNRRNSGSCTFNQVFYKQPRRLPFNIDAATNLFPFAPNQIIRGSGVPLECQLIY